MDQIISKKPTLTLALIPIICLIALLSINVWIYGDDTLSGSNQLTLLMSAAVAAVIGYFADLGYGKSFIKCIVPLSIGTIIIFVCGIGYLSSIIGFDKAIAAGLIPFIPSELFKIALAVFIIPTIWKFTNK